MGRVSATEAIHGFAQFQIEGRHSAGKMFRRSGTENPGCGKQPGWGVFGPAAGQGVMLTRRKPLEGVPLEPVRLKVRYS